MKIRRATTESEDAAEAVARGACSVCKVAHTACDGHRPCKRCVAIGKADMCFDVEPKKRACGPCRAAHTACDSQRPCKRCVTAGKEDQCVNPQLRKKGRRTKKNPRPDDSCPSSPTSSASGEPSKRQRLEEPDGVRVGGTGSPVSSKSASSPPLSPLLPPPFPLPNLHGGNHLPFQQRAAGVEQAPEFVTRSDSSERLPPAMDCALPGAHLLTESSPLPFNVAASESSSVGTERTDEFDACSGGSSSIMQLEPLLAMFMKELRELRSANEHMARDFRTTTEELRREILMLHQNQQRMERRLDVISAAAMTPPISFPASPSNPLELTTYSPSVLFNAASPSPEQSLSVGFQPQAPFTTFSTPFNNALQDAIPPPFTDNRGSRREILSYLPFLASYNLTSPDAPFVVDNLRKPFFALQIMESMPGEEFTPPIFVFANSAFCSLVRQGEAYTSRMEAFSEVIRLSPLFLPQNGRITRLSTRVQFFYNEHGRVKWKVCCVDGLEESGAIEMPINWLPGLPKWWTTLPLSLPNLQQQQQSGFSTVSMSPRITEEIIKEEEENDTAPLEEAFLSSFIVASSPHPVDDEDGSSSSLASADGSAQSSPGQAPPWATPTTQQAFSSCCASPDQVAGERRLTAPDV